MTALALAFDVLARDKASGTLDKIGGSADGLGKKLGGVGKVAAVALGGVAATAVAGLGAAMFQGFKDAVSYETITKKLGATIKATGGAAGTSVKHMQDLAGSLESMSGVDEELILNSQNVLATFKNISNKGPGDMFDDATRAALDLSTTMNGDLQGASVLVGKALNDPIKGLTALGRAGVSFTEDQKKAIKSMVETGDVAGAQKVILAELKGEFGGAAKAAGSGFAGDMARLKDSFSDVFRELATALLPTLSTLGQWLAKRLPSAIETVRNAIGGVVENVKLFWNAFTTGTTEDEGTPIERIALTLREDVLPVLQQVVAFVKDNFKPILIGLGVAVVALASPFLVVAGAAVFAYMKFKVVREAVQLVIDKIGEAVDWVKTMMPAFQEAIGHAVAVVQAIWRQWGDDFMRIVGVATTYIKGTIENILQVIRGIIQTVTALINGDWGKAWDGFKQILAGLWDQVVNIIRTGISLILDLVRGIGSAVGQAAGGMFDGIKNAFKAAINWVIRKWNSLEFTTPSFSLFGKHSPSVTIGVPDIPEFHTGGMVTAGLPRFPGDSFNERTIRTQVGETISTAGGAGLTQHITVTGQDTPRATAAAIIDAGRAEAWLAGADV